MVRNILSLFLLLLLIRSKYFRLSSTLFIKNAIDAYRETNPSKNLYVDFVYGALLKMKEYNAHTDLEAYRKLMELFPIGPLRMANLWQRDNMHFPRQQTCAIQVLEQMERNAVILDEEFCRLTIAIFGDWTHVVKKAKRQLYWLVSCFFFSSFML